MATKLAKIIARRFLRSVTQGHSRLNIIHTRRIAIVIRHVDSAKKVCGAGDDVNPENPRSGRSKFCIKMRLQARQADNHRAASHRSAHIHRKTVTTTCTCLISGAMHCLRCAVLVEWPRLVVKHHVLVDTFRLHSNREPNMKIKKRLHLYRPAVPKRDPTRRKNTSLPR